jgi:hypothetical protein
LGSVLVHDVKPVSPAAGQGWLPRASD